MYYITDSSRIIRRLIEESGQEKLKAHYFLNKQSLPPADKQRADLCTEHSMYSTDMQVQIDLRSTVCTVGSGV